VGDEAKGHGSIAVVPERLICHDRPKVGAADADVHNVANALAGVTLPRATADAVGEVGHLIEDGMHLEHDILAVECYGRTFRGAQSNVQNGALLGDIDLLAAEHGIDATAQIRLFGELDEELESL